MTLEQIENKFKEYYKVDCDLSQFPITEPNLKPQQDKERSKALGEVFTPIHIVDEMIAKISPDPNLLVLDLCCGLGVFGIRWIRYLHNNNPNFQLEDYLINKLHFLDIDQSNCDKVSDIFQKSNVFQEDATTLKDIDYVYDVVFSNPPFNKNMDLKILKEIFHISKEWVIVHPSTWLFDLKGKTKLYIDFKSKISKNIRSINTFNGSSVFNIVLNSPTTITHIDKNYIGKINVEHFGNNYKAEVIFEITKYGQNWSSLVKPYYNLMKEYCLKNGNVWQYNVVKIDNCKFYCQLASIIGNINKNFSNKELYKDDFYTLIVKDENINKGTRILDLQKPGNPTPTFEFSSEIERNNFIQYLKTDFVRFNLSFLKNNPAVSLGEMELIPWLDFTEEWDDEKLFKKFDVSQELQDYIREFLPDYYGIRK